MDLRKYLEPKKSEPTKIREVSNVKNNLRSHIEQLKTWFIITINSTLQQE